jgi:inorganic pyrophosphatase
MNLLVIPPFANNGVVRVVIETPRGSRTKLKLDPQLQTIIVDKMLPAGMVFPGDFGFIPRTQGADGDPLDALVIAPEPLPSGCLVPCRIIGVVQALQSERKGRSIRNDRYLAVSAVAPEFDYLRKPSDLPDELLAQFEQFFVNYNQQEGRKFRSHGVLGPREALQMLHRAEQKAGLPHR